MGRGGQCVSVCMRKEGGGRGSRYLQLEMSRHVLGDLRSLERELAGRDDDNGLQRAA